LPAALAEYQNGCAPYSACDTYVKSYNVQQTNRFYWAARTETVEQRQSVPICADLASVPIANGAPPHSAVIALFNVQCDVPDQQLRQRRPDIRSMLQLRPH
jgi:hypothetical protein